MGWKGALRSMAAAQRRAEREARRRQRELERQREQLEKMQELEQAAFEVQVYENYVDLLRSVHKECGDDWDWEAIGSSDAPDRPIREQTHEESARSRLDSYEPGVVDKMLSRTESKRQELLTAVDEARQADEREYQEALGRYNVEYAEWEAARQLAVGITAGRATACLEAIKQTDPFGDISELGSPIDCRAESSSLIEATLCVKSEEVIPSKEKRLLSSGKLSVRAVPKTRFYEQYQDYVCGCVLRVARELFALLPIETVIVHATSNLLNTETGDLEEQPILSVAVPRKTLARLNFETLDLSDSMANFVHRMALRKTRGFSAIEPLKSSDFQTDDTRSPGKESEAEKPADEARQRMVPEDVRTYVWRRDRGKCVNCGSRENLEFDHIIPVSKGGSNTARNIQLLCETCNREKSDNI